MVLKHTIVNDCYVNTSYNATCIPHTLSLLFSHPFDIMARASVADRPSAMYACDREESSSSFGAQLFEPAPSSAELLRVRQVLMDSRLFLVASPSAPCPKPEELAFVTDMWLNRWDESAMELHGDSVTDEVFVARCFLLCMADPRARVMATLNDINELYVRLQLLGTNHTRHRFDQLDSHMEVERLEKRCACLIVYDLSHPTADVMAKLGDGRLPAIDEILQAVIEPLRHVPDTCAVIQPGQLTLDEAERQRKLDESNKKDEDEGFEVVPTEEEYDVNEGSFWHGDKETVVRGFVAMASRVLRNYWLQKTIFDRFPVRAVEKHPIYSAYARESFLKWMQEVSAREYSDSSVKVYRNLIYEHWMPLGSRQETLRTFATRYDFMQSLNLLENQLGVDSATSLANIARSKMSVVSKDEKHEVFDFLLLSQFSYMMFHKTTVPFLADYYIMPGQLCKYQKRLECKRTWGRPRRPILLRIMRGWWVHDDGEWISCTDMTDALLKMMTLWMQKYDAKFASDINVTEWVRNLTSQLQEDEWEAI